jgi:uncharacterized protein YecE (DUF72 family)
MASIEPRGRVVDLSLSNTDIRDCGKPPGTEVIRVGCAGWNVPREYDAHFKSEGTHLERYSRTFNCCEINSSFYRPHQYSTWERWSASVPQEFRFSVKVPRTITHELQLKCGPEHLTAFLKQVQCLGKTLGPLLIQLPPRCAFDPVIAGRFFALLRELYDGDVVLEARHASWFHDPVEDLQRKFSIGGVAVDPACVPRAGQPTGFNHVLYFRLHGSPQRYYSSYSPDYLKALASQLVKLGRRARAWCVFDNTAAGFATSNALQFAAELTKVRS